MARKDEIAMHFIAVLGALDLSEWDLYLEIDYLSYLDTIKDTNETKRT